MNPPTGAQNSAAPRDPLSRVRFYNVDLLRFVSAIVVAIYHLTVLFPDYVLSGGVYANTRYMVHSIAILLFNGPAAVMIFFIVSGICIHAPYRGNQPIDVSEFYTRRFIRIGLPLLVAWAYSAAVAMACGSSALPVWSLWCEMAYYSIYPGLLLLIGWCGFRATFLLSVAGVFVLSLSSGITYYGPWSYGPLFTWILYLPVWLGGVWICENANRPVPGFPTLSFYGIVVLGGLTLFGVPAVLMLLYKLQIARPLPLTYLFSLSAIIFIALAVKIDLMRFPVIRFMERQGRWSYSLYLIHFPLIYLGTWLLVKGGFNGMHPFGLIVSACGVFILSILLSLVFYRLVEKPSHILAKHLALQLRKRFPPIDVAPASVIK